MLIRQRMPRSTESSSSGPTLGPDVMGQTVQSVAGTAAEWVWAEAGGAKGN